MIGESDRGSTQLLNAESDPTVEYLQTVFMEEISGPSPQIGHFIRNHDFPRSWPFGRWHTTEARWSSLSRQKQYEQDIYNFSRTLGHSMDEAERWVLKAREFWCVVGYGSTNTEKDEDVSSSNEMLDQAFSNPSAGDLAFRSKDKLEDNLHMMTTHELKGPEQLQHPEFPYFKFDRRSGSDEATPATLKPSILSAEPSLDNGVNHNKGASRTDTAVEREEKAGKRARKALKQEMKKATRQAEKRKRKKGEDEQIANLEGPAEVIQTVEEVSQFEQLEDKDKSQRQKKKGRKRKEEFEVLPQSKVHYGEQQQKHKKRKVESDALDLKSRKSKTKKRSLHYSPFFQRSSLTEAGKDVKRKVNQLMDHEGSGSSFKKKDVAIDEAKMLVDFPAPMI